MWGQQNAKKTIERLLKKRANMRILNPVQTDRHEENKLKQNLQTKNWSDVLASVLCLLLQYMYPLVYIYSVLPESLGHA